MDRQNQLFINPQPSVHVTEQNECLLYGGLNNVNSNFTWWSFIACLFHTLLTLLQQKGHISVSHARAASGSVVHTTCFHTLHLTMVILSSQNTLGRVPSCAQSRRCICYGETMLCTVVIIALSQSHSQIASWWSYKLRNPIISINDRVSRCLEYDLPLPKRGWRALRNWRRAWRRQ